MIFNVSVINGGNRELYFGVKSIAEHKRNELLRVEEASLSAIYFFRDDISSGDNTKIYNNSLRLKKIYDLTSYVKTLVHPSGTIYMTHYYTHLFSLNY